MPGCSVSLTTRSFCSVVNRRRRATPVMTSTFENVSDIGVCLGLCLVPPANAGVRSKQGAVQQHSCCVAAGYSDWTVEDFCRPGWLQGVSYKCLVPLSRWEEPHMRKLL